MKTEKLLLYALYIGGAYFVVRFASKFYSTGRDKDLLTIFKDRYDGFDDRFLDAWANGKSSNMSQFPFDGKMHDVKTGKVVTK